MLAWLWKLCDTHCVVLFKDGKPYAIQSHFVTKDRAQRVMDMHRLQLERASERRGECLEERILSRKEYNEMLDQWKDQWPASNWSKA